MRQRVFTRVLAVLCALHVCATLAFAQFDSATVLGFISDQSGAAMPGVTVTLTNPATGISTTAVTDDRGQYQFLNVRVGTYSLEGGTAGLHDGGRRQLRRHGQRPPARRPVAGASAASARPSR